MEMTDFEPFLLVNKLLSFLSSMAYLKTILHILSELEQPDVL